MIYNFWCTYFEKKKYGYMDPYGDFPWRSVKLLGDEYYMLARFSFPTVMRYNPIELSAGLIMGNEATIIWSLKFRLIIPQFGFVLWMIPSQLQLHLFHCSIRVHSVSLIKGQKVAWGAHVRSRIAMA